MLNVVNSESDVIAREFKKPNRQATWDDREQQAYKQVKDQIMGFSGNSSQNQGKGYLGLRSNESFKYPLGSDHEMAVRHEEEDLCHESSVQVENIAYSRPINSTASIQDHIGYEAMPDKAVYHKSMRSGIMKSKVSSKFMQERLGSSVMDRPNTGEKQTIIKRKKKKLKSRNKQKTTVEMPNLGLSFENRSYHSKCKEEYENEPKSVAVKSKRNLQYSPNYQNDPSNKKQQNTPASSQSLLTRKTGQRDFRKSSTLQNLSKSKQIKKSKTQTVGEVISDRKGLKINKSLTVLSQIPERESKYTNTHRRTPTTSMKNLSLKRVAEIDESPMLMPRYSSRRSSQRLSRSNIPGSSEVLYQLGLEKSTERVRKFEEAKAKKERDTLVDCTFKPNISAIARKKSSPE